MKRWSGPKSSSASSTFVLVARTCLLLAAIILVGGCVTVKASDSGPFVDWAAESGVVVDSLDEPLESDTLDALQEAIGTAQVVGIGESRHDTREQCHFKSLFTKSLIKDSGYRVFILEESFSHVEPLDHYVTSGQGDLDEIMNGLAGWYLWDTVEMKGLFQWIRHFNEGQQPGQRARIFGMDITAPALGVRSVLNLFEAIGVETFLDTKALGLELQEGDMWTTTWQRYGELSLARRDELRQNYSVLVKTIESEQDRIIEYSSAEDFERITLLGEIGTIGNTFFSSSNRGDGGLVREKGMAQVAFWILEQAMPKGKAILWAHNLHIAKSSFQAPGFAEGDLEPMGTILQEKLGERYLSIGGTFGQGATSQGVSAGEWEYPAVSPDILDGALNEVGLPNFFLDLRSVPKNSKAEYWLHMERECRAQGFQAVMVPGEAYDMLYFVSTISRAEPSPLALQRSQSLSH